MAFHPIDQDTEQAEHTGYRLPSSIQDVLPEPHLMVAQVNDDIIDSLPGVFYILDEQGRLVRWNSKFASISGYSDQEL
ncbi:MAG: PAS domain S-box protein [Sterolibacterium sp.]|jgi:PAS domain-containing protein|nr:PAS domain S-box protein [Sterolibacterium sp.]